MYKISYYFLLFLMYAILGWIMEVINSYINKKRFVNRGFLIGPYCPIYGVGVLLIITFLKNYTNNFIVLFILAMTICMVLEYLTSYIMEVLFNARWWDYSNNKFNINGRICLETAIPFGLGGLIIMYVINPIFIKLLNGIDDIVLTIVGIVLMVIFLIDMILSFLIILKFKNVKVDKFSDDTEDMNRIVKNYLIENSRWTKRLITSFPSVKIKLEKIKEKYDRKKSS